MLAVCKEAAARRQSKEWIIPRSGAKKRAMKKQTPVTQAVSPVRPPSRIPVADSMKTVKGLVPMSEPTTMPIPAALTSFRIHTLYRITSMP